MNKIVFIIALIFFTIFTNEANSQMLKGISKYNLVLDYRHDAKYFESVLPDENYFNVNLKKKIKELIEVSIGDISENIYTIFLYYSLGNSSDYFYGNTKITIQKHIQDCNTKMWYGSDIYDNEILFLFSKYDHELTKEIKTLINTLLNNLRETYYIDNK